jgi:hypothetical protein
MTFRLSEVVEGIQGDMRLADSAKIFAACLSRLAKEGRDAFDLYQKEAQELLSASDQGEASSWLADLFPEE